MLVFEVGFDFDQKQVRHKRLSATEIYATVAPTPGEV
jgi:hypothetical protein